MENFLERHYGHYRHLPNNRLEHVKMLFGDRLERYEWDPTSGVYMHVKDGRIVYVGRSVNMYQRHLDYGEDVKNLFDELYFLRAPREVLPELESEIITLLRPERNWFMIRDRKCKRNFIGPLPFRLANEYLTEPLRQEMFGL